MLGLGMTGVPITVCELPVRLRVQATPLGKLLVEMHGDTRRGAHRDVRALKL